MKRVKNVEFSEANCPTSQLDLAPNSESGLGRRHQAQVRFDHVVGEPTVGPTVGAWLQNEQLDLFSGTDRVGKLLQQFTRGRHPSVADLWPEIAESIAADWQNPMPSSTGIHQVAAFSEEGVRPFGPNVHCFLFYGCPMPLQLAKLLRTFHVIH